MLRPRLIPFLLLDGEGLVKTQNFKKPKYLGDPINTIRIFNEKMADEISIFDIQASVRKKEPNYELIKKLAMECRMPICIGGGISNPSQVERIIKLGVEKVSISSSIFSEPNLIKSASEIVGSQSIAVTIDYKKDLFSQKYSQYIFNGKKKIKQNILETIQLVQDQGVGEIILNNIDCDGVMKGYDFGLLKEVEQFIKVPITLVGGAGSNEDFRNAIASSSLNIGLGAGSFFVFKGKLRAVLISYPAYNEKIELLRLQK